MSTAELKFCLTAFVVFARSLKGDEKGEAQIFLDHFFRALGHGGVQEAGATLEFRIAKKPGSAQLKLIKGESSPKKGGKKFADLLWPDRVLIEMKSRGSNLEKHYDQVFDYWTHIVPKRPPTSFSAILTSSGYTTSTSSFLTRWGGSRSGSCPIRGVRCS